MKPKYTILFLAGLSLLFLSTVSFSQERISHYTCGMHPSVKVSPEAYDKGDKTCPICHMGLVPVYQEEEGGEAYLVPGGTEDVISRVKIKSRELQLAGVQTEPVIRRHLFKEIRAVGTVAYDPQLTIAQDEFVSAVKTLDKIREGQVAEIIQRAESLVNSARRKLRLLGLDKDQIKELEYSREVQTNLILPEEKMWIYGEVYEHELNWVKKGSRVKITTVSLPGEEILGEVVSINPVLDPRTRSLRFRALVDNPGKKLKPEMYVNISILTHYTDANGDDYVLSIPKSAFLDTGRRKVVWVDMGKGQFEGRSVKIGPEAVSLSDISKEFYPVLTGLREGERVVTKANFLIDSQSQITGVAASAYGGAIGEDQHDGSPKGSHGH